MSDPNLGRWTGDNLQNALSSYSGSQYYSPLPSEVHFVHSVAKIIAKRNALPRSTLDPSTSFYILGAVPEGVSAVFKREPTFSMGGVELSGKIWFGSEAMNSSNGTNFPKDADDDALFKYISQDLKSGSEPAVFFVGTTDSYILRFYPRGVDSPDDCEDVTLGGSHLNNTTLKKLLDKIHDRQLLTPTSSMLSSGLWENGQKYHPVKQAEKGVQCIVESALASSLGNVRVKCEATGKYGRYDLALIEQDPLDASKTVNHAILELKIVKAFTSTGKSYSKKANQNAVIKGIKQAFAYRNENSSRISALCCYDMRPIPDLQTLFDKKCELASKLDVELWAWSLFPTTEAARNNLVQEKLKGDSP